MVKTCTNISLRDRRKYFPPILETFADFFFNWKIVFKVWCKVMKQKRRENRHIEE